MAINLKRALLTGTALVAASFSASAAQAAPADLTATGMGAIWAESNGLENAVTGDNIDLNGYSVVITNDGTADDGLGLHNFEIGDIVNTNPGFGGVYIYGGSTAFDLNVTINNVSTDVNFNVQGLNANDRNVNVTVSNGLTASNLDVRMDETSNAFATSLNVSGGLDVDSAFMRATYGADALLTVTGDADFGSGLQMYDTGASSKAILTLNGDGANIYGAIDGFGDDQGTLVVNGASSIHGAVGAGHYLHQIELGNIGTATFNDTVDASEITFSSAASVVFKDDVNMNSGGTIDFNNFSGVVSFDSNLQIGGDIVDSSGNSYGSVRIENGKTVITSGSIGTSGNDINSITVAANAILMVGGDIFAQTTNLAGDLKLNGATEQTVGGDILGSVYSNIAVANTSSGGATFEGYVSTNTITVDAVADNATAVFNGGVAGIGVILGGDGYSGDINTIEFGGSSDVNFSTISGANSDEINNIIITGGAGIDFNSAIGKGINSIQVGADGTNTAVSFYGNIASGAITLGTVGGDGDTNTVFFNAYDNDIAVDVTLDGDDAADVNNIGIADDGSGYSVTQNAAWTNNLTNLKIYGAHFISNANLALSNIVGVYGEGVFEVKSGTTSANVELDEYATLVMNGGNVTGNVYGLESGYGHLAVVQGQTATIDGDVHGLGSITLGGEGAATLTVTGKLDAADVTNIGIGTLNVGGDFSLGANQELDVKLSGGTTSGQIIVTGNAFVDQDAKVVVSTSKAWTISDGTKFTIIDGNDAGTGVSDIGTNLDVTALNSALVGFSFEQDTDDLGNFVLVAHTKAVTGGLTGLSQPATAAGDALQTAALTSSDPAISDLMAALDAALLANDKVEAERLLTSIAPTVDGGAARASVNNFAQQIQHIAQTRMLGLMQGEQVASNGGTLGIAAGSGTSGVSVWTQAFGQTTRQDMRDMIAGYDADSAGASVGIDSANVIRDGLLGVSFSYGRTNANSKNSNQTGTDIDSYGVNVYASKVLRDGYFMNGQLGYAYNDIDSVRHNVGLGGTASASYKSDLYSAQLAGGKDYMAGHGLTLTPSVSASYLHLATDGYTETGSGAPLLTVGSENSDSLRLGVGLTAAWNFKDDSGAKLRPALSVGYAYDALADNIESTAQFVGGGPAFKALGARPARNEFNGGAALTYVTPANWDLSVNYDYTMKQDFDAHTGVVRATVHF